MKMTSLKVLTLLALFSSTNAFWKGWSQDNGMIEMDMHITERPKQHLSGLAHHLQVLDSANASETEKDYIDKQLYDFNNIQIFSKIYVGSERREFDMIFDTGSSWLWIENKSCDNCANPNKFNNTESSTFKQLSPFASRLYYGRGMVEGVDTSD